MGILDKFRSTPKTSHADPAVRIEALRALDADDQAAFASFAKDDADAKVRRAAVARVTDPVVLGDVVRNDADDAVKAQALEQLVERASRHDVSLAAPALDALMGLGLGKELAQVAKADGPEALRRRAVEALTDPRLLGSIARHAALASVRLLAVSRVHEAGELEAVALRGEHGDAAVAAIEALPMPSAEWLQSAVQKARSKAAQKRARSLARALETAAAPVAEAPAVVYKEADQAQAHLLVGQMVQLQSESDPGAVRDGYAGTRVAWVELLADADVEPATVEAFEVASSVVRDRIAADDVARLEAERVRLAREHEQAERAAVCAQVEQLQGEAIPDGVVTARTAWEALPVMPSTWAADLQRRFDEACAAADKRHERHVRAREMAERVPTLLPEIEALVAIENHAEARTQWFALRKQWQAAARALDIDPALTSRYGAVAAVFEAREQALRESKEGEQQQNLQRLQAVVADLEARAGAEALTLKAADDLMKAIKLAMGTMGPLPTKQDRDDLTVRLQAVRTSLAPRIQELREGEEWKRWANVQVQEELCARMEALIVVADTDPEKAGTEMKQLQERWKPVAAAPRSQATTLWTRFKAAQDQVYEKCKDFFAQQQVQRAENQARKVALAEKAEALKDSTDWVKTADAIKALQAEWKAIGPVTRGSERALWERFRAACDAFFTRRQEDLKQRKNDWTENLRRKEALVAEAEQLSQSSDWEKAASRIKQLQVEWKGIGPVKRSKSEAIWERFRGACDVFFERFKNRDQVALQGKVADRETAVAELEALVPTDDQASAPSDLFAHVQAARARWVQAPELPRHVLAPLADRVNAAMLALVTRWPEAFAGTDLDPSATRDRMTKLIAKVEKLLPSETAEPVQALSPAELLARQWREALAANTMGGGGAARQAEDARQRAAEQEVRAAQAAWNRLGPLANEERKPLQERFDRTVRKFFEMKRRASRA